MKQTTPQMMMEALLKSHSLEEAEENLSKLNLKLSLAMMWGLWDGWSGRPGSLAGLGKEPVGYAVEQEYETGRESGRKLALRNALD